MKQLNLLLVILIFSVSSLGQTLRVIHPNGHIWTVYQPGDELQLYSGSGLAGNLVSTGQLVRIRPDTILIRERSGVDYPIAVRQITGLRPLPTIVSGLAVGAAFGATALTLIDKREPFTGPHVGLSLLIGAGAGAAITYWQRMRHRKRVRHRADRGWLFQVH